MLSPRAICTVCMTGPTNEQINSSVMSSDDPFPLILMNIDKPLKFEQNQLLKIAKKVGEGMKTSFNN